MSRLLHRAAVGLGQEDRQAARQGQEPAVHARRLLDRSQPQGQEGRHRPARPRDRDPDRRARRRADQGLRRPRRRHRRADDRRGRQEARSRCSQIGAGKKHRDGPTARQPIAVQDVFFRIGGPHVGKAKTSMMVDSDHVILDNIWAWRADHGEGVGWKVNTAANGVIVNGDRVTATGLFVEHYQRYNVIWNGERGRDRVLPERAAVRRAEPGRVAARRDARLGGLQGERQGPAPRAVGRAGRTSTPTSTRRLHLSHSFEVPDRKNVRLHDLVTVSLNGAGTIDHVVNDTGDPAVAQPGRRQLDREPGRLPGGLTPLSCRQARRAPVPRRTGARSRPGRWSRHTVFVEAHRAGCAPAESVCLELCRSAETRTARSRERAVR